MVDKKAIQKIKDLQVGDEDSLLGELCSIFFKSTPHRFLDIQAAIDQNLLHLLDSKIHSIQSSCAYLGATRMVHICKQIEDINEPIWRPIALNLFRDLQDEYEIVKIELQDILNGNDP